jgi:hypothetical protein
MTIVALRGYRDACEKEIPMCQVLQKIRVTASSEGKRVDVSVGSAKRHRFVGARFSLEQTQSDSK